MKIVDVSLRNGQFERRDGLAHAISLKVSLRYSRPWAECNLGPLVGRRKAVVLDQGRSQ